jgi:uncharacterized protein YuzE
MILMKMTYSREGDAFYLKVRRGKSARMVTVAPLVNVDFDAKDRLLGVEVLGASFHIPRRTLLAIKPRRRRRA